MMLLESLFNLTLGMLLFSMMSTAVVSLTNGEQKLRATAETSAMWANATRVIREDVHAAVKLQSSSGGFSLVEADGRSFRYLVNGSFQLVRVQTGGGTAVLALGVKSMVCQISGVTVLITLTFQDGRQNSFPVTEVGVISQ